jgi:hypothetical protein
MTKASIPRPLEILAGVRPLTEGTALTTRHAIASDKIRTVNGFFEKIGGWLGIDFDNANSIVGKARSIFSTILNSVVVTTIGTDKRLYSLYGTTLLNITPLSTSSVAVANSLATLYGTLANNPITTVNGSKVVTIADANAGRLRAGDTATLSGANTTNGVPNTDLNAAQIVRSVAADGLSFTIIVATAATSSGSGGGASVVRRTGIIQVTKASHGLPDGDRVKLSGAADTGGILAAAINLEFIIRVTSSGTFDVMTATAATSSVSSAGGASTVYYPQIAAGLADETGASGYGAGKYGVGLYGTALTSSTAISLVRAWHTAAERFGDVILMTAGNQTGLYEWNGVTTAAPVLVTNAPTAINYAFVTNNIAVTFGAGGVENRIKTSDQGDRTNWTSSSTNQVFVDDIEGAGRLLSHVNVSGVNLIFTRSQSYTFRWIGGLAVFEIKPKDLNIGIISPMARVVVNGIAFWMGENNFYMWRGGNIEIMPANSQAQSTLLKYVFENINRSQLSKCFAWHNPKFNEIWFHYPSEGSNEPDRIARVNLHDFSWTPDTMNRTAAEYPNISLTYPRLINSTGMLYYHERGVDDDGAAMVWSLTSPDMVSGKNNATLVGLIPDSVQTGTVTVNVAGRRYPQSTQPTATKTLEFEPDTEHVPYTSSARLWRYTFSGEEEGQNWTMGMWFEDLQEGAQN